MKRRIVASARPRIINRPSLAIRTSVLVGILCPPILSIAHLGNRQELADRVSTVICLMIAGNGSHAVFRLHASYRGAIGRKTSIANLVQQGAITDLERFRRATAVPVVGLQDLENDLALQP